MSSSAAERITPKGRFESYPGQHIIAEFRAWVNETGQPDLWRYHAPSKPPHNPDYEILCWFEIPEKKREEVCLAACPICSPTAGKYYRGTLAWFFEEGVIRAIGRDCAASHFGTDRHNAAIARGKAREDQRKAEDYLLETLPQIASLRDEVAGLQIVAQSVDHIRQAFWHRASKTACLNLARLAHNGPLTVEELHEIASVDIYGNPRVRREPQVVKSFQVVGHGFLSRKSPTSALAENTATILERVHAADEEAAFNFICDELSNPDFLFEAEKLARAAITEVEKLRAEIGEAKTFLTPDNLANLSEWSMDRRSGAPLNLEFDYRHPALVKVGKPGGKLVTIPIRDCLR